MGADELAIPAHAGATPAWLDAHLPAAVRPQVHVQPDAGVLARKAARPSMPDQLRAATLALLPPDHPVPADIPDAWERHGDLILLPETSFTVAAWAPHQV